MYFANRKSQKHRPVYQELRTKPRKWLVCRICSPLAAWELSPAAWEKNGDHDIIFSQRHLQHTSSCTNFGKNTHALQLIRCSRRTWHALSFRSASAETSDDGDESGGLRLAEVFFGPSQQCLLWTLAPAGSWFSL